MRTKTLLLTAALTAAGLASSMAQVYSVNAVGYVKITIPAGGKLALIANPLKGNPNNELNTIMPLAADGSQDGVTLYRFNNATQNYYDAVQFSAILGGWFSADPAASAALDPGEGVFIQNTLGVDLTLTFVGDVLQAPLPNPPLTNPIPGNGLLSIKASQVPQGAALGTPSTPNTLGFPAVDGDTVYVFDVPSQNYLDAYQFSSILGGWFSASDPNPDGPVILPGQSFFVQKSGPAAQSWDRNFSVN